MLFVIIILNSIELQTSLRVCLETLWENWFYLMWENQFWLMEKLEKV